jgi:transposase
MKHFDAKNLIFIDESGANLRMSSSYARTEGGNRIKMAVPLERGPQFSIIGAISVYKVEAALYGEWATDGEIFYTFIVKNLLPQLKPKHTVIMDNIKFHLQERIREAVESKGANIIFLPPYSPDLSPIENMWSKIKNSLRRLAPRTIKDFEKSLKSAFEEISKNDLIGWFKHCGYECGLDRIVL